MQFDKNNIAEMDRRHRAHFINSLSGFRSANLIGTKGKNGQENLAIFNSVCHIGAHPPLMAFILRPLTVARHSYQNIIDCSYYTINHIHHSFIKAAHHTAAKYPESVSEFEKSGLSPHYEGDFYAPYVKESRIRIGLKLEELIPIRANDTLMVVGAVEQVHIDDELLHDDAWIDLSKAGTVAISNLDTYYRTELMDRFAYARPDEAITSLRNT